MDFGESDDEGLPTHADSTSGSLEEEPDTSSSFPSSGLAEPSLLIQEPPSPATARKRANEEIYEKAQRPLPSTTPLKLPPSFSFEDRVSTEPKRPAQLPSPSTAPREPVRFPFENRTSTGPQRSSTFEVSFKDSQPREPTHLSSTMTDSIAEPGGQPDNEVTLPKTFVENVAAYQEHLENEFKEYEKELKGRERSQELQELDWQDLEAQYQKEIGLKVADEEAVMREFQGRFAQFMLWMQVSGSRESERAVKRLRTRVAFVQNSEGQLGDRQEHYGKVLAAFQNAMALLGNA